jgi:hypothetical protein
MANSQRRAPSAEADQKDSRRPFLLRSRLALFLALVFFSSVPVLVKLSAAPQNRTLVLTGHPGELTVMEMGGRYYVDVEALTRVANGSIQFKGNQIVLTLSTPTVNTPAINSQASPSTTSGFSKDFLRAAIEEMSVIREWRSALINAIRQGHPVTEDWVASVRGQAQENLRLVSVAASTDGDRNALRLLNNEFTNLKKLTDRFVEANRSRTYVSPNALDNDPLDQKILSCAHSLAAMAANNQFVDDGSCQ